MAGTREFQPLRLPRALFRAWLRRGLVGRLCIYLAHGVALAAGVSNATIKLVLACQAFPRKQAKEIHEAVSQRLRSGDPTGRTRFTIRTFRIHSTFPLIFGKLWLSVYFLFRHLQHFD